MDPLLNIQHISKRFDGLDALQNVSTGIRRGSISSIIGPNGAGKTTFFNIVCGLETADSGKVVFKQTDITKWPPEKITRMGLSRTFQTTQIFKHLNVIGNIMVGRYFKTSTSFLAAGFWLPPAYREEHRNMVKSYEILEFIDMYDKADRKISQITFYERKLVEIGRCLAMEPDLLMLDEPFGGLTRKEIDGMTEKLAHLKQNGTTLILIDHHFGPIAEISDEIVVLNHGEIIAKGTPQEIEHHQAVLEAYLPGS